MDNIFLIFLFILFSFSIKPIKVLTIYRYYLKTGGYYLAEFSPRSNDNYVQAFKSHLPMLLEWKKKYDRNIFEIILYQGGCWYFDDDNDVNFRYKYNKLNNSTYCYFYYKSEYIFGVSNFADVQKYDDFRFSLHEILACDETNVKEYKLFDVIEFKDIDGNHVKYLDNKIIIKTHFFDECDSIFLYDPDNYAVYFFNFDASHIGEEVSLTCEDRYEYKEFFSKELEIYKYMRDVNYSCSIGILKFGEENKELDLYPDFRKKQEEKKKQKEEEEEKKEKKSQKKITIICLVCFGVFLVIFFSCVFTHGCSKCNCCK